MPADDDLRRSVGGRIAEARRERGLTQEQLGERMDASGKWIQRVESGSENLELDTLGAFAAALDVPASSLLQPPIVPRAARAGRPRIVSAQPAVIRAAPFAVGAVPFVDLVAGADPSAALSMPTTTHWVNVPGRKLAKGDFVARVRGTSMEPDVPDGSLCLFRQPVPKPAGKTVLIERLGAPGDIGGQFLLKRLRVLPSGRVRLMSSDSAVDDILGELIPIGDLRVVAQLVDVLTAQR